MSDEAVKSLLHDDGQVIALQTAVPELRRAAQEVFEDDVGDSDVIADWLRDAPSELKGERARDHRVAATHRALANKLELELLALIRRKLKRKR